MKRRYFLQLSYKGSSYHGWQRQPDVPTVQEAIEKHLQEWHSERVHVHGCGRTDRGVHAHHYVAHADLENDGLLSLPKLQGIHLHKVYEVDPTSHAQHHALNRTYCYLIGLAGHELDFDLVARYYHHLDIDQLKECAALLIGEHDFAGLCRTPNKLLNTRCRIDCARWDKLADGKIVRFTIKADRFLPQMVRIVVAAMLDIVSSQAGLRQWDSLLQAKSSWGSRSAAYSNGLYFAGVEYPDLTIERGKSAPFFDAVERYLV